ncbi:hypothetical protein K439DRAFT_1660541 [Ramaria rubella]|nr:hypothetical protein K439DRAFT_1660541 [Ramaria rubella]
MMSRLPDEVMNIVENAEGFQAIRYGELVVLAFSLYDLVLCLSQEIDLVWRRPFRYMTILYFVTRHLMVISLIIDVGYNPAQPHCSPVERIADVMKILACACTLILLVVCSWAMFDRSRLLLSVFGFLALTLEGVNCFSVVLNDCADGAYLSKHSFMWSVINIISQFSFDSVVMFLVLYNAFCAVSFERSLKALQRRTLANLILYDGLVYYSTIFAVSLAHVLLSFLAPTAIKQVARPFIQPLSSLITARFLLHMRYMEVNPNSTTMMALTTLAITVDWQVQTNKSDDYKEELKDPMDATYQQTFALETGSIMSCNMAPVLQRPSHAMLSYDAAKEISGMLEKTFCA